MYKIKYLYIFIPLPLHLHTHICIHRDDLRKFGMSCQDVTCDPHLPVASLPVSSPDIAQPAVPTVASTGPGATPAVAHAASIEAGAMASLPVPPPDSVQLTRMSGASIFSGATPLTKGSDSTQPTISPAASIEPVALRHQSDTPSVWSTSFSWAHHAMSVALAKVQAEPLLRTSMFWSGGITLSSSFSGMHTESRAAEFLQSAAARVAGADGPFFSLRCVSACDMDKSCQQVIQNHIGDHSQCHIYDNLLHHLPEDPPVFVHTHVHTYTHTYIYRYLCIHTFYNHPPPQACI